MIEEVLAAVRAGEHVVLHAPPGAGKTTAVPRALLEAGAVDGEILVLEPRRIAARMAGRYVASKLGEAVGDRVGYRVRFDTKASASTRLTYMTEALLLRRFLRDPALDGVGLVVFDEFHERHLHGDLALALSRRLDVRLIVMSATMEASPIAGFLGEATVIRSEGRQFDVSIEYVDTTVSGAVRRALADTDDGHVLVFLPGVREIEEAAAACARLGDRVLPLHGRLSSAEQDAAVAPSSDRKVILATNVAETSVTIDGVVAVVDSGLARIPEHDPWSGLSVLRVRPVSRASAAQRAGRAGRTRPGRCYRLYTKHDHDTRREFESPEVKRFDLSEALLFLDAAGISDLEWPDPPPDAALDHANALLARLGAGEDAKELARWPVHPRQARILVEAQRRGVFDRACTIVAELSDPRSPKRVAEQLRKMGKKEKAGASGTDDDLLIAVLAGYPDRVAKRRGNTDTVVLSGGGEARVIDKEILDAPLMVALEARRNARGKTTISRASPIEVEWLLDLYPDSLREVTQVTWNKNAERVDAMSRLFYDDLVLEEDRAKTSDDHAVRELLEEHALAAGPARFADADKLSQLLGRIAFIDADVDPVDVLRMLCAGRRSFAELRDAKLLSQIRATLTPKQRQALDSLAPEHIQLKGGRKARVRYERGQPPWTESYLQDFFGMTETPRVGGGSVPVTLHLLAPNRRAVQVTTDLAGFWERHYPQIRKQLKRRYPKHGWPENPLGG